MATHYAPPDGRLSLSFRLRCQGSSQQSQHLCVGPGSFSPWAILSSEKPGWANGFLNLHYTGIYRDVEMKKWHKLVIRKQKTKNMNYSKFSKLIFQNSVFYFSQHIKICAWSSPSEDYLKINIKTMIRYVRTNSSFIAQRQFSDSLVIKSMGP